MDGNRTWAKQKLLPSFAWHKAWFENAKHVIETVVKTQIEYLTLWALSKENLESRSKEELTGLFSLFEKFYDLLPLLQKENIVFQTIWDISKLPENTRQILNNIKTQTSQNTGMTLIIALVYSWQDEIVRACRKLLASWYQWELNESNFRDFLDIKDLPQVDLIIRTGWHQRHSWFLLYDSAYSEYAFTDTLFPAFKKDEILKIINDFSQRERKFWK